MPMTIATDRPRPHPWPLAEDLRRIAELFAEAPGGVIVTAGPQHEIVMLNAAYSAWIGHRDVVGQTVLEAFPNLGDLGFMAMLDKVFATGAAEVMQGARTEVQRAGRAQPIEAFTNFVLQPMRDAEGRVCGIFCQGQDVTSQKLAEAELRAAHEQLRAALRANQAILDNSYDLICTIDADARFRTVSPSAFRILGYTPAEMIGRSYRDFIHPDDIPVSEAVTTKIEAGVLSNTFTTRYLRKDGTLAPMAWTTVWSDPHESLFAIGRDMSEHAAAEEKLRQAQKMEVVGRLTGGIAHDFNNLLTVVIGATEGLAEALADRPDLAPVAGVALEAAQRGAELVGQLMAASRTQPLAPQTIDCNRFADDLLPMLRRTLGGHIAVELSAADGDVCCLADRTQLTSAILNLCVNGRDAMPEGGRLTLSISTDFEDPSFVRLSVGDTGEGMTPAVLARALEPFFTTKVEGTGTGLGLAMVNGFAIQSGGRVEIDTTPGVGTTMTLCLPRTGPCLHPRRADTPAAELPQGLRVLLVEDDDLVRGQVVRQLEALGCAVTARACGYEALDVIAAGEPIQLMVTDINMPGGLNGRQLADHVRLLAPDLPILFSSGHTQDPVLRTAGRDPRTAFLAKPYRRVELASKLAELLRAAA